MKLFTSYKNKIIYLSPHSPMTLALEQYLLKFDIHIEGFIDSNKIEQNIYKIQDLSSYDYVLILSPNHFKEIYLNLLNNTIKEKLVKVDIKNGKYQVTTDIMSVKTKSFFYLPKDIEKKRKKIVFISKGFISSNNKALYLFCIKNSMDTIILTDNKYQLKELEKNNLPSEILDTKKADYEIAIAKFIIFDQGNYTYLPPLHHSQKTVQLWHGVGLKKMSKMDNIVYDYFVSTSNWTNESNFKKIFNAKNFLSYGYPRNDIFFRKEERLDFLLCDEAVKKVILENEDKKIILYSPTHRENNSKLNLNFDSLNEECEKTNVLFILKLHPFILEYYKTIKKKEYSNIYFYDAYSDIYPLFKHIDILVSDYSSIVYDFLLLNKPIIFYIYDIKDYTKNVSLLFDYDEYSPGIKVFTQKELTKAFRIEDNYQEKREIIRDKFFEEKKQLASKNILDRIIENNYKVDK